MRRLAVFAVAIASIGCRGQVQTSGTSAAEPAPDRSRITSADQLLEGMHRRYVGKWYWNLAFTQKATYYRPDGTESRSETWYEALGIPGRLRIDLGDPSRGNGALYRNDSLYSIQEGRIATRQKGRNLLLILGFDVYAQPPARTLALLRDEGINTGVLRRDTFGGRPMYVVGAGPGDTTSNQFWVDADRLLFVRLIQSTERGPVRDTRFEKYVAHGGGWVAEEVRFLLAGRIYLHEVYSNIRVNEPFDPALFIPEKWKTAPHWFKP